MSEESRESLVREIIEHELEMFLAVTNEGGQADCQKRPDTFRLMRGMAHSAHGMAFLKSYLHDLREAKNQGRNFMTEKYARMDDLIPPLNDSHLLDWIADAECAFKEDAAKIRPGFFKDKDNGMFRRYLRCELETFSQASLQCYAAEIEEALKAGINPVLARQAWLEEKMNGSAGDEKCKK